ncbi:hypothetical protein [Furfurilactobacillus milii]|uniref:Uncharacterized protein n=1 Tax=Furfurilactobacillus rossiae TaxID=231049 RepID=A0A7C9IPF4_9LACO|nr:hypothetical protein [Furfurilactobacillus milii]MYV04456.1 hypothetical protein [Furfurilactobacillus milii]
MLYFSYDKDTYKYTGASSTQTPFSTTINPEDLVDPVFNEASNQWSGTPYDQWLAASSQSETPYVPQPSAVQLMVMGLTQQVATLNSEVAEIKSAPSEETTQSQAASTPTSQASSASEGSAN